MNFTELVTWVRGTLKDLDSSRYDRDRVGHLRRLHLTLSKNGAQPSHWKDWHALACKCAELIGQPAPPTPDVKVSHSSSKVPRERTKAVREEGRFRGRKGGAKKKAKRARVPKAAAYEISPPFRQALDAIAEGTQVLFVTGRAGTGKSTFIRILRDEFPEKNIVVVAPTGIAALNAGGQTIHSFFHFPPTMLDPAEITKDDEPEVFEKIDILVIDEVSMVRADLLDAVDASLRINRKSKERFGGVQVVLVGDLFQLPPVPPRGDDALVLRNRYHSFQFFGANCLRGLAMTSIELSHVYRQTDQAFIALLGDLRTGRNVAAACAELNRQCANQLPDGPHLVLAPKNDAADRENARRLAELAGRSRTYTATLEGNFRARSDDRLPAPHELTLKPQAQVMFTKNDAERRWVNGTTGTVLRLTKSTVEVELENGAVHEVEPERWENIRYQYDSSEDRIIAEVAGAYEQFPLMPAWAVTIHKAQGLTLARVHVDFGSGAFAEGQAYVALSRCRRLQDLSLARPLRVGDIKASAEIAEFYAGMGTTMPSFADVMALPATGQEGEGLTDRETRLLAEHLEFYRGLVDGTRKPSTSAQEHFVAVARGLVPAESEHERAFLKWRSMQG